MKLTNNLHNLHIIWFLIHIIPYNSTNLYSSVDFVNHPYFSSWKGTLDYFTNLFPQIDTKYFTSKP